MMLSSSGKCTKKVDPFETFAIKPLNGTLSIFLFSKHLFLRLKKFNGRRDTPSLNGKSHEQFPLLFCSTSLISIISMLMMDKTNTGSDVAHIREPIATTAVTLGVNVDNITS